MIDLLNVSLKDKFTTSAGAKNLTGSIGSYIEATIDAIIHWECENFDGTLSGNAIISNDGTNFISAGFKVGDIIQLTTASSGDSNDGEYEIIGISSYIVYVGNAGSTSGAVSFSSLISDTISIYGKTPITNIDFYYGLVENSASASYNSLLDGETQKYRASSIDTNAIANTFLNVNTLNKSWEFVSSSEEPLNLVRTLGTGTSGASTGYEQYIRITHVFHIAPVFLESFVNSSEEIDQSLVSWFNSSAALKYVFRIVGGFDISSEDHTTDNGNISTFLQNGDTGFYDEFRNGGVPKFTVTSTTYTNSATETVSTISSNDDTSIEVVIENATENFSSSYYFDIYIYEIPSDSSNYLNVITDGWTNFAVSNVFIKSTDSPTSDNNILNADVGISGTTATITFTKQATLDSTKKYLLFIDVGKQQSDTATDNHHTVLCDYNSFAEFINTDDLIIRTGTQINDHSTNDTERAYSDYKGWIEDGLLITDYFKVKKLIGLSDEFTTSLSSVNFNISCENQTDSTRNFTLENIDLTVDENTTRGFKLYSGDPKNYLKLTEGVGDATYNEYTIEIGTKIRFESFVNLPSADADFTTATQNWSIYDLPSDWFIYLNIITVTNIYNEDSSLNNTYTQTHKTRLRIKNYEEYNACEIDGSIATYHATTDDNLSGQILKTVNTKVIASFTGKEIFPCIYSKISNECDFDQLQSGSGSFSSGGGDISDCPDYYGIIELAGYFQGEFQIRQISTLFNTETDSPFIGEIATNKAKLIAYPYASPPRIDVLAEIDYSKLDTTLPNYTLSARLGKQAATICKVSIQVNLPNNTSSYTNPALSGFSASDLLLFNLGVELIVKGVATILGSTFTFNPVIGRTIKICCAKNKLTGTTNGSGEFTHASLIGLTLDDFIGVLASNGREFTTGATFSFNSGLGKISGLPAGTNIAISFHTDFVYDNIVSAISYTDIGLSGLVAQDIMCFVNGEEQTSKLATISGTTITFPTTVTGIIKIVKVQQ